MHFVLYTCTYQLISTEFFHFIIIKRKKMYHLIFTNVINFIDVWICVKCMNLLSFLCPYISGISVMIQVEINRKKNKVFTLCCTMKKYHYNLNVIHYILFRNINNFDILKKKTDLVKFNLKKSMFGDNEKIKKKAEINYCR